MSEKQRLALVTGGMGGIGTSLCERLAKDGFKVIATYHPAEADKLTEWSKAREGEIALTVCDVSSAEDCIRMAAEVEKEFGLVDVIVNCAGITRDATMKRMDAEKWDAVINPNLTSAFYITKPFWEGMLERGFGRIINISSVNGQRGQFGQTNYSSAKAGIHGFTMALAHEGAAKGITANTVSPGYIKTAMTDAMRDDVKESIVSGIPMGRMGLPEEIASAVAFLAADEQAYITGANIPVNGALFIH
mgnify:CR=1 FL=1